MSPAGSDFYDEVRRALEERPRLSLRLRIALVFVVCVIFITAITAGSIVFFGNFRRKLDFLEVTQRCVYEIEEARRFEKNFFLYGTSPFDALDHIHRASHLLEQYAGNVADVAGDARARMWTENLTHYEQRLQQLVDETEVATDDAARRRLRREAEGELRRFGAEILQDASTLIGRQRASMDALVHAAVIAAGAFLGFMILLMLFLADQLMRQVLRPIGRFTRYVERIAAGDFTPIMPTRKYKDEFSTLAVAVNRMLAEIESRQEQLLQSRKMAAVGTLTSGIAHELNNPLNNISLTTETLLDELPETMSDCTRKMLEDIFIQVQRASATVRSLLDFTRRDKPVLTSLSVAETVERASRLVSNELKLANIEVHREFQDDLPHIRGNPRNLEQVFLNLLLNAKQAMPDGGTLTMRITRDQDDVRVDLQDTGVGIPPDALDKIFEPFFTTKEAGEGTGLGLSVTYSIIENHCGRVEVTSEVDEGTTFSVFLPVEGCGTPARE